MNDKYIAAVEQITSATLKMNVNGGVSRGVDVGFGVVSGCPDKADALRIGCINEELTNISNNSYQSSNTVVTTVSAAAMHRYIAFMPTERNAMEYNMNHKRRGMALIFNHETFDIPSLEQRLGTNVDCEKLRKALTNLHFDVRVYKDCKLKELIRHIEIGKRLK